MEQFAASQRKACELANIARSSFRYRANTDKDDALREKLTQLAHEKPRYGYEVIKTSSLGHLYCRKG